MVKQSKYLCSSFDISIKNVLSSMCLFFSHSPYIYMSHELLQLLVQSPSQGGRAILHLQTVQFYNSVFKPNILGVNTFMDIERTFNMKSTKTMNLNTHMQTDSIYVDFGLITNAGKIFSVFIGNKVDKVGLNLLP